MPEVELSNEFRGKDSEKVYRATRNGYMNVAIQFGLDYDANIIRINDNISYSKIIANNPIYGRSEEVIPKHLITRYWKRTS